MSFSNAISNTKLALMERFFVNATEAQADTMEILMDIEQIGSVLSSLEDIQKGNLVCAHDAFGDL